MDGIEMRNFEGLSCQPTAEFLTAVREMTKKCIIVDDGTQGKVGRNEIQSTDKGSNEMQATDTGIFQDKYLENKNLVEKSISPLLTLPPEIRNLIYTYVLRANDGQISLRTICLPRMHGCRSDFMARKRPGHDLSPSLVAVNHQVFAETRAMLYGQPLRFECRLTLELFLKKIGGRNHALLQDITIAGDLAWWSGAKAMMGLLSEARELKRLRLEEPLEYGPRSRRHFNEHMAECGIAGGKTFSSSQEVNGKIDKIVLVEEWRVGEMSSRR